MKTRLITYAEKDLWNEFVANSSESPILQSFEWGELKSCFGWQPLRLAIEDQGKIVAGASILKREIPYIKHSLFYCPRGPVVDFHNKEIFNALLSAIEKEAEKHHAISFKIDPDLSEENVGLLKSFGFEKAHKQIQPRASIEIDLEPDLNTILMRFDEKTRYNVRLAEKKGVSIREQADEVGIKTFYQIYQQTALRDKFMIHPIKYYQKIREVIFEKGLGTNFVAYYKDKPIASVIVFCFGKKIWYMYGASSSAFRNVMPNHLLHWEIIKWAKEKRFKTYDLWGIPAEPKPGHPLYGVYRFKRGFNGKSIKNVGVYDHSYSPILYHALEHGMNFMYALRSLLTKGKIEDSLGE